MGIQERFTLSEKIATNTLVKSLGPNCKGQQEGANVALIKRAQQTPMASMSDKNNLEF